MNRYLQYFDGWRVEIRHIAKRAFVLLFVIMFAAVQASGNLLVNPGFESGDTGRFNNVPIPGWVVWNSNGWHHDDNGRTIGDKAVKIWWVDTGMFQDFDVVGGRGYTFSAKMLSVSAEPLVGREGLVKAEFYDGVHMEPAEAMSVVEVGRFVGGSDALNIWKEVTSTLIAPEGAVVGRIVFMLNGGGSGALNFDEAFVASEAEDCDFNNDGIVNLADVAMLALDWMNPSATCDLDDNGMVDVDDLLLLAEQWLLENSIYAGYQLVWADEFNGSVLDGVNWERMTISGKDSGNWELQHYTTSPSNAWVEDGELIIQAKKEDYRSATENRTYHYTSARLTSSGKRDFLYGMIEARIKLPKGQGMWPAFWMLPTDWEYGGWPGSGEIDIMESANEMDYISGAIHYGGEGKHDSSHQRHTEQGVIFADDYHVFTVRWEEESMEWYIDGKMYFSASDWWSDGQTYPAPFDKRFHILLNIAVGGHYPGAPDETTVFPQKMHVDYVRVYQRAGD